MRIYYHLVFSLFSLISVTGLSIAQKTNPCDQVKELGSVSWYRNYDEALAVGEKSGKPIFILFQEVPGCSTCQNYGKNVLSNPLLVDIIENEYVPLAIYNNKGGDDAKILNKYKEASWNNPVIRVVNANGKDLVTRLSGNYSKAGLASYIRTSLTLHRGQLPVYVDLITKEFCINSRDTKEIYYSMYCFWTGEAALGNIDGVVSTSPGFMNGKEVVKLSYNPEEVSEQEITKTAKRNHFTFVNDPSNFRIDKDPQYHLKRSVYKYLALSPLQRTKINTAISKRKNPDIYLSPTQLKWKENIQNNNSISGRSALYNIPIKKAWKQMISHAE